MRSLSNWDAWSPDDPAIRRGREALARRLSWPAHEAPGAPPELEVEPVPTREEIQSLRDRAAAGDRGAAEALRDLLAMVRR